MPTAEPQLQPKMQSPKPPEPILRLQNCTMRPYYEGDVGPLAGAANNPEIARWMRNSFPHPYKVDDARRWISLANSSSPVLDFAICKPSDHRGSEGGGGGLTFAGGIGLKKRDDIHYRTMKIGYWLGQDHWHQGIATEAVTAFSDWAFDNFHHLVRLEAEVFESNVGSCRVLEKAGFTFEARHKNAAVEKLGILMDTLTYCKFRSTP